MQYIEAPQEWLKAPDQASVFLAGGITDCPDWQKKLAKLLTKTKYTVFNPRREHFPIDDPSTAKGQITWEFNHLRKADIISVWFCKETIQPIVLYELGAWSMTSKPMIIGVEKGYKREIDVCIQTGLVRPDILILNTLEAVANELIEKESDYYEIAKARVEDAMNEPRQAELF